MTVDLPHVIAYIQVVLATTEVISGCDKFRTRSDMEVAVASEHKSKLMPDSY